MVQAHQYYVVTADIIRSRKQRDAAGLAEAGLSNLNVSFRSRLAAEFTLYRGDEIQGAFKDKLNIIPLIRRMRFFFLGLHLRIGVGRGEIVRGLEHKYAWQMDGSAFHYSREALERIKNRRAPATCFAGDTPEKWAVVNAFYGLMDSIQNRWSDKQWQAVDAYERLGTFEAAASELGISLQNVSKRCQAADWKAVAEGERFLASYLEGINRV